MALSEIAMLACGQLNNHPTIGGVLGTIAKNISKIERRILDLPTEEEEYISLHGPFYGRTLLENVCIALVGRVDPFRLLVIKKVQEQGDFGLGSKSKIAIQWSGDIVEESLSDAALLRMWRPDLEFQKICRGLLGDYYGKVFWEPAYQQLLDKTEDFPGEDLLSEYRAATLPEKFTSRVRSNAFTLFSALSKGIHGELVVETQLIYDRVTVLEKLSETMKLCAILSLVSHMQDSWLCQMHFHRAIGLYKIVKERSDSYAGA